MKKLFHIFFLLILSFMAKQSRSQILFYENDSIPVVVDGVQLQNAWAGGINFPQWSAIDLNGDSVNDLFLFDRSNNRVSTFINTGVPGIHSYHYAPEYIKKFPPLNGFALMYDYNNDGKPDLFSVAANNNGIIQYRNDYTQSTGLTFTCVNPVMQSSAGENIFANGFLYPHFNDIDGDGDMDVLTSQNFCVGTFAYWKNNSMENYSVPDHLNDYQQMTNSWGNFQLNTGSFGQSQVNQFHITPCPPFRMDDREAKKEYSSIFTLDLDGDGDKDALIGGEDAYNALALINDSNATYAEMAAPQDTAFPSYNTPVHLQSFNAFSYLDVDNDGVNDLLVGNGAHENKNNVWLYKNESVNNFPHFNFQTTSFLQDEMIDVGQGAAPVFFDADGDGLLDIVVGNENMSRSFQSPTAGLYLFKNTGTFTNPAFELIDTDYAGINALNLTGPIFPAFGDMDGDNALDMILGENDGQLYYFHNNAAAHAPANFALSVATYMGIDVGNNSTPQIYDLNHDNLPDLVVGEKNGLVNYFQNTGTNANAMFAMLPTNDTLGGIIVQSALSTEGYSVPFLFNDSGYTKMLVGCMQGNVYLYDNIDGNLNGSFHFVDTTLSETEGSRYQFNLTVSGGDINGDNLADMLIGLYGGGMHIYYQSRNSVSVAEQPHVKSSFEIFPNPANSTISLHFYHLPSEGKNLVKVYNTIGEIIFEKTIFAETANIASQSLAAGIYMVQLITNSNSVVRRLMVQY